MQYNSIPSATPLVSPNNEPLQHLNYQPSFLNSQKKASYQEKASRVMKNSGIWPQGFSQNQFPTQHNNEGISRNNLSNKIIGSNRNLGTPNFLLNQSSQGTHNIQKTSHNYRQNGVNNVTISSTYPVNSNKGIFVPLNAAQSAGQRHNIEMGKSLIYGFNNSKNQKTYSQTKASLNNGPIIEKLPSNNTINENSNENCNSDLKIRASQANFKAILKPMKNSAILISNNEANQNAHNCSFSNTSFDYNRSQQNQTNYNFYPIQVFNQTSIKKKVYRKAESQNSNVSQFLLSSPNNINLSFDSQPNSIEKNLQVDAINQVLQEGSYGNNAKQLKNLVKINRYIQSPSFKKNPVSFQQMQFLSQKNYQKKAFALHYPVSDKQDFLLAPPSTPLLCKNSNNDNIESVSNTVIANTNMYESPTSKMYEPINRVKRLSYNSNQNGQINQNYNIRRSSIQNFQSVENKLINLTKVSSILQTMAKSVNQETQQIDQNDQVKEIRDKGSADTLDQSQRSKRQKAFSKNQKKQINLQSFSILRHLGTGKYGKVYLARQKHTNFICALKQIQKKVLNQEQITEQFIRQLKIQTFISHPNIIKMYGFFQDENNIYIILQAGTGGQLYDLLKKMANSNPSTTGLPENKVAYYMRQICQAVKQLHSHRIIHRDIKPQNIVIHDNVIKLCDFGWSVRQDSKLRTTFCGTPLYVCPQILKGQQYDQKIDIWSLGVMMYEMAIGQNPFKITKEQQLIKIVKEEVKIPEYAKITKDMEDILAKCLKKNPDQRAFIRQLIDHQFFKKHPDKQMEKNRMAGLC